MQSGLILIINGASSSGKTSLVRALQERLVGPVLDAGLDRYLWMLPARYLSQPLWNEVLGQATTAGPVGQQLVSGMHQSIAALSRAGNTVAADHVLVEAGWVRECAHLFAGLPAYLFGLRCPLTVLEERERERQDRTWGQAAAQFELVHAHCVYDLELDSSQLSATECAEEIARFLAGQPQPQAWPRLHERRWS